MLTLIRIPASVIRIIFSGITFALLTCLEEFIFCSSCLQLIKPDMHHVAYTTILLLLVSLVSSGRIRHCYVCRSRGELGDCKDPFQLNGTTVENVKGVEAVPCASGWCGKIVEGQTFDFDTATERLCIQRPPSDGEERCSNTIIEKKKVYMCFCLGDLCNGTGRTSPSYLFAISLLTAIFVNRMRLI